MADEKKIAQKVLDDLKKLKQIQQASFEKAATDMEKDFVLNIQSALTSMERQVKNTIKKLSSTNGIVDNNAKNIAFINARMPQLRRIVKRFNTMGQDYFADQGMETQKISQEDFNEWSQRAEEGGIRVDASLLNERNLISASNQSVLLWNDFTSDLADVVRTGLIRRIIGAADKTQLIEDFASQIPGIEKRKSNGQRFRLSAFNRAKFIVRTETTRLYAATQDKLGRRAFGNNPFIENFNPLDARTAPVCIDATVATEVPMRRDDFIAAHGLPPRHVNCRCVVSYMPEFIAKQMGA